MCSSTDKEVPNGTNGPCQGALWRKKACARSAINKPIWPCSQRVAAGITAPTGFLRPLPRQRVGTSLPPLSHSLHSAGGLRRGCVSSTGRLRKGSEPWSAEQGVLCPMPRSTGFQFRCRFMTIFDRWQSSGRRGAFFSFAQGLKVSKQRSERSPSGGGVGNPGVLTEAVLNCSPQSRTYPLGPHVAIPGPAWLHPNLPPGSTPGPNSALSCSQRPAFPEPPAQGLGTYQLDPKQHHCGKGMTPEDQALPVT